MNFRKILVALLSIAMLLSLAACGGNTTTTKPTTGTVQTFDPEADGMLYLSMGAEIKVTYDKTGNVMTAEPANEAGQEILAECPVVAGTACNTAVADLVKATVAASTSDLKVILIKQAFGSATPSKEFMSTIKTDAEAVAGSCAVIAVAVEELTGEGYLPIDAIKAIFMANIGAESAMVTVSDDLVNGIYYVSHKDGEVTSNYTVDADNGVVTYQEDEPVLEGLPEDETVADDSFDPEMDDPGATEPYMEEPVDDPIFPEDVIEEDSDFTEPTFGDEEGGEPEATDAA